MLGGDTKTLGVIGDPISHSLSPVMHNAALTYKELNYCYLPFLVKKEELKKAINGVLGLNISGINVTAPHKEEVLAYLDDISKEAVEIGAVNTIVNQGGKLLGYNTDGEGFVKSMLEKGFSPSGKTVMLLGVGGAAKSVAYSLAKHEALKLILVNRTLSKAEELKEELLNNNELSTKNIEALPLILNSIQGKLEDIDIIINGLPADPVDDDNNWIIPLNELKKDGLAVDFRYHPLESDFLATCKKSGLVTMNGLLMLIYQGAIAFELFTGEEAPLEVMKKEIFANL